MYDKAIRLLTKHIESGELSRENLSIAYRNRGYAWLCKFDIDKALADYTKAIEIEPKLPNAYFSLAWLMATCPESKYRDGKRAVELARKAVALKDDANFFDGLASAEAGRFQEAIKTQKKAIKKLKQEGGPKYLPEFEEHLSSYKAGKPWCAK
jgi:tetratricopeptide (TPR) repeat protein